MEILRILLIIFIFSLSSLSEAQNNSPDTYFIDIADETFSQVSCEACPENVGKMIIARPMTLGEIKDPSDIKLHTCHFSLVAPNIVQTASHCGFAWSLGGWDDEAEGECSKVFGFYLPGGRVARCKRVLADSEASPNLKHTRPDTLLIEIDQSFRINEPPIVETEEESHPFEIWGSMDDEHVLEKRTCRLVENSILSPLRTAGFTDSAFLTLSCDGPIIKGFSGAGVFQNGQLVGNISQALSETGFSPSVFGNNEVTVSRQNCSPDLYSGMNAAPSSCFFSEDFFDQALLEVHFQPLDRESLWQQSMIDRLQKSIDGIRFSYMTHKRREVLKDRGFGPQCVSLSYYNEKEDEGEMLSFIRLETEKMHQKFIHYNEFTEILGYWSMYDEDPIVGSFFLGLDFEKTNFIKLNEGLFLEQESRLIPLCESVDYSKNSTDPSSRL